MQPAQVKKSISPDVLNQIDVRVGTILTVTDVPNSEKLIALDVSFGDHRRTVLTGMKQERANPREIEGKQALFVVNLATRKMAGMISEGMLFDIGYPDGITPLLAMPEKPVPDGTRVGVNVHRRATPQGDPGSCRRERPYQDSRSAAGQAPDIGTNTGLTLEYSPECMISAWQMFWQVREAQSRSAKRRSEPNSA